MKRNISLLYLSAVLWMTACTKETAIIPDKTVPDDAVCFQSCMLDTRTYYEDTPDAIKVSWLKNDRIGLFATAQGAAEQANIPYQALADGKNAEFVYVDQQKIIRWTDFEVPHDFYAYYPYSEDGGNTHSSLTLSLPATQSQEGMDNIGSLAKYDFIYASATGITREEDKAVQLHFNHLYTILDIAIAPTNNIKARINAVEVRCKDNSEVLAFKSAELDLATGKIDLPGSQGGSSTVRLECGFLTNNDLSPQHFYVTMTSGHEGKEFEIVAFLEGGDECVVATKTAPEGGFLPKMYMVSGTITPTVEIIPVDLSANGTANTYIVNQPSMLYSFDATVKGNGIARDFYATELEKNLSLEPKSVLVLWYNCLQTNAKWKDESPVVISGTCLKDGKIRIETPYVFVEGNAVVVAFAEEGVTYDSITVDENGLISNATILWSWNIWAVKDYEPETCGVNVGDYYMMDRNLGALRNELPDEDKEFMTSATIGNYYQWGRKDPFPPHADSRNYYPSYFSHIPTTPTYTPIKALQYTNTDNSGRILEKQIFSNEGTGGNCESSKTCYKFAVESYEASVALATGQPHKFISSSDNSGCWLPTSKEASEIFSVMWGDPTADGEDDARKSIYDPCPPGWKLWTRHTMNALREVSQTELPEQLSLYGVRLAGSYFPVNGGGRNSGNFGLGWIVQPQAEVNFMGWTATAELYDYWGWKQKWYSWSVRDGEFKLGEPANGGHSDGRIVRCIRMDAEVAAGGGGMTAGDGEEDHDWYE